MFLGKAKSLRFGTILRPEFGHCGSVSERDHSPFSGPLIISPSCLYSLARNYRLSRFYERAKFYKRPGRGGDYRDFPRTSGVGPVDDRVVPGGEIEQKKKREETERAEEGTVQRETKLPKDAFKNFTSSASPRGEKKDGEVAHEGQGKKAKRGPGLKSGLGWEQRYFVPRRRIGRRLYRV